LEHHRRLGVGALDFLDQTEFIVSDQCDRKDISYLERVNAELTASLRRCHALVEDCRAHLAPANSNEPEDVSLDEIEDERA